MKCKGKPIQKRKGGRKTRNSGASSAKSCRVCSTSLFEGNNWSPSRVKRHDYICNKCRKGTKKIVTASPKCPKCNSRMVKRYSTKYSRHFWGCSKFPSCKGTKNY